MPHGKVCYLEIPAITAEASAATTEMRGRLVLRGMSPSTRLQPPDFMQFILGATRDLSIRARVADKDRRAGGFSIVIYQ